MEEKFKAALKNGLSNNKGKPPEKMFRRSVCLDLAGVNLDDYLCVSLNHSVV
ncbi:MAG: hypothetical protein V3W04_02315 [Gammaproteobacteria bacterium]